MGEHTWESKTFCYAPHKNETEGETGKSLGWKGAYQYIQGRVDRGRG